MHDPRLTYIYMRKDSKLQCMHKAAAQHRTPLFSPSHCKAKQSLILISLNRCGMVGVGLGASLKEENQIWSEKRILLYFQIIMS